MSLSKRDLRDMAGLLRTYDGTLCATLAASLAVKVQAHIDGSLRRRSCRKAVRQKKSSTRAEKNEEMARIRAVVFARATNGLCELRDSRYGDMLCCLPVSDLHHAFGRRGPQSSTTCLALCRSCHRRLTNNEPSAEACWGDVAATFDRLGDTASADRARERLRLVAQRAEFSRRATT